MGGTNLGRCANCECDIDYDPLLSGKQYCDDCHNQEQEFPDIPLGISKWIEYGKKWGYYDYIESVIKLKYEKSKD